MSAVATLPMSPADVAAHQAASYVRPLPRRTPGAALQAAQVEAAYAEREQLLAEYARQLPARVAREIAAAAVKAVA
jgi:hypothetical protein